MLKPLISTLVAGALAASAYSTPAYADNDDVRRAAAVIFGLAALAAIANAANNDRDDDDDDDKKKKDKPRTVYVDPQPRAVAPGPRVVGRGPSTDIYGHNSPEVIRRERPRHSLTLPASCRRQVNTDRGVRNAFGAPCLQRSGINVARLPNSCARTVDIGRRNITAWTERCLRRAGVVIR